MVNYLYYKIFTVERLDHFHQHYHCTVRLRGERREREEEGEEFVCKVVITSDKSHINTMSSDQKIIVL